MAAVKDPAPSEHGLAGWTSALLDGMDDALFIHDLAGNILEANNAACQRLGYTHAEMLRLTTRDIDDPSFAAGFEDRLTEQLNRGQFRCEGRHRTKDGRVIAVDINTSAIQFNGQPAVLALMRDITQRKVMEGALRQQTELLQSILDSMGDAVIVADENGEFLLCNPAARRMFALPESPRGFPASGPAFQMYLPDRVTPYPPEQLPLALSIRGEAVDEAEIFVRHTLAPEGRWLSATARPLRVGAWSGGHAPTQPGGHAPTGRAGAWSPDHAPRAGAWSPDHAPTGSGQTPTRSGGILVCRDITGRKRSEARQNTQHAVTRALDECADLDRAGPVVLRYIGEGLGWDVAALWLVDPADHRLHCRAAWHLPGLPVQEFIEATKKTVFPPGRGLPGRVWATQHSAFVPNVTTDRNFPRAEVARRCGLVTGFAFPIRSGGETIGVIESFNRRMAKPDAAMMALMATMGSQIGQVLERQRVEKALRDSEAFYHSLVESLPQNIYRKDRAGRVTFGNQRYVNTLGKPLAELLGKTDFDLFPEHLARKYVEDDAKVMAAGKVFEAVEEHHLPDGTDLYVQVIKSPIWDSDGQVIGTQGVFWDVTERKRAELAVEESERRYRQLTEATQDAIVVADQGGRICLFNPAAERMFGYPATEVICQPLTVLMPEEYHSKHEGGFARFLATRQPRLIGRPVELHGRRKDGSTFPLELVLSVIDVGGNVEFLGAIRDLTERNRIRAVLVQNEKLASIGLMSAGVAHEINNPLAFVANNLAVLERDSKGLMEVLTLYQGCLPELAQVAPLAAAHLRELTEEIDLAYIRDNLGRLLARTRDGVDRVTRIVHSLRGLARTDSPRRQETNVADLVETSLDILRGQLKRQNVNLVTDYDPNSMVQCVQGQISQVLLNLLVNAQQAIDAAGHSEGGGRITVLTKRLDHEMLIEVGDNGTGIQPGHLAKLFDPFFTTKDVGQGTGLGLSIAHNIVRAHGGRIEVESTPGVGTRFRVYLPLHPSQDVS